MKTFFLIICFFFSKFPPAQITTNSLWTWMKGDTITNNNGLYGTQGIVAAANKSGSRGASISWTDLSGNLWLFGGTTGSGSGLSDLWEYNPITNNWTWMTGDTTFTGSPQGVYGTQGQTKLSLRCFLLL